MTLSFPNGEASALNRMCFPETRGPSRPGRLKSRNAREARVDESLASTSDIGLAKFFRRAQ